MNAYNANQLNIGGVRRAADKGDVRRHFLAFGDSILPIIHELGHVRKDGALAQQSNVADGQKSHGASGLLRAALHDCGGFCDAC